MTILARTEAACANHPHTDWWLSSVKADRDRAIEVCRTCPLQQSCREQAVARRLFDAVRGGLHPAQLRALAGEFVRNQPRHGSRSCYTSGCRRPECRLANRLYIASWRGRRVVTRPRRVMFVTEPDGQMAILVGGKR